PEIITPIRENSCFDSRRFAIVLLPSLRRGGSLRTRNSRKNPVRYKARRDERHLRGRDLSASGGEGEWGGTISPAACKPRLPSSRIGRFLSRKCRLSDRP